MFYLECFGVDSSACMPVFAVEYHLLKLILYRNLARTLGSISGIEAGQVVQAVFGIRLGMGPGR